jgi:hypothetical protein
LFEILNIISISLDVCPITAFYNITATHFRSVPLKLSKSFVY